MIEKFEGIMKSHFLRITSKSLYVCKLKKLMTLTGHDMNWIIRHPVEIKELITDMDITDSTKVSFVSAVIAYFIYNDSNLKETEHELFKQWDDVKRYFNESIKQRYGEMRPTTRQKLGFIDYEELQRVKERLDYGSERLLMTLYLDLPPIRADYFNVVFKELDDGDGNYIIEDDELDKGIVGLLIINDYKTSKKYSRIEIPIPTTVMCDIKECLKERRKSIYPEYESHLFLTSSGRPYKTRQSWTVWANTVVKDLLDNPSFSLTMFRHIYVSRPDLGLNTGPSTAERERLAKMMGHSTQTQVQYQWRD